MNKPDPKELLKARLAETFENDTQEVVARKLMTTQGNVSKWLNGQIPTTDNLLSISKAYKVSGDWLLGISDEKEIDGVVLEKLTYEQIARIIDRMFALGIIEIPDLEKIKREDSSINDYSFNDAEDAEESEDGDEENTAYVPRYDSDYMKINDRVLSYVLRRRVKIYEIGEDMVEFWKQRSLPNFKGVHLLRYNEQMQKLIDSKSWSSFKDGDWVAMVQDLQKMTDEEILAAIEKIDKEGKNNG